MQTDDPSIEAKVSRLITEYAQAPVAGAAQATSLDRRLTLRGDLAIDSLALVSLTIRLGEEFNVDIVESGLEFGELKTVGDLLAIAEKLHKPLNNEDPETPLTTKGVR